ncbi:MAG: type II secretion system protein E [Anaerolineaceae bacterium]|nr:type II secretion system protein E [Anaerolineaceae bacterium]
MTSPSSYSMNSPEIIKLKQHLMNMISRELENNPPLYRERDQYVRKTLTTAYNSLNIHLPGTIQQQIMRDILDDILGFGALQPLLEDESVTEIMVNGPKSVYIEKKGRLTKTGIQFDNDEAVIRVIEKIIMPLGRRIDADSPTVDARLPDGSRVNAVIPPVAIDGPSITIRKFQKGRLTIEQLIDYESITSSMAELLQACVISKLNLVVSGGTGSGKTTLLNVLSGFIPSNERIVTIEDAAELKLQQDHVVRLETKPANVEGKYSVTIRDLVRNSLRMRPDRIVVGEVRGGEALDMLQAMNTGHDGSLTTLHANTPRDALSRLETMCLMAGMDMPLSVIREQIASAVDVIVQQSRLKDGSRKVTSITEVSGMEGNTIVMTEIFKFEQTGTDQDGKVLGQLKPTGIRPFFSPRLEQNGFKLGPEVFGVNLSQMLNRGSGRQR